MPLLGPLISNSKIFIDFYCMNLLTVENTATIINKVYWDVFWIEKRLTIFFMDGAFLETNFLEFLEVLAASRAF